MNEFDPRRLTLSEEELEQTLRDFFAAEMPAELRAQGDAEVVSSSPPTALPEASRARRIAAPIGVAVAVVGFCATVWISWSLSDGDPRRTTLGRRTTVSQNQGHLLGQLGPSGSAGEAAEDVSLAVSSRRQPIERQIYDTGTGAVEQRTDVVWTNVSYYEPETGASVQWSVPELTIEILPIPMSEASQ